MFVGNGYRCIGGPLDGEERVLPPGDTALHVAMVSSREPRPLDGPAEPLPIRHGEYRIARHATHGYVLRWHEPA